MIAANNDNGAEDDREIVVPSPVSTGGQMGGCAPNIELNDRRVQSEAKRLLGMVEAGAVASDDLKRLAEKIKKRTSRNDERCSNRDLAALGKLQLAIAQAADAKAGTTININGPSQIQVVFVDDWYGSKAANLAATNAASTNGADKR
jgi:hypothetical protein